MFEQQVLFNDDVCAQHPQMSRRPSTASHRRRLGTSPIRTVNPSRKRRPGTANNASRKRRRATASPNNKIQTQTRPNTSNNKHSKAYLATMSKFNTSNPSLPANNHPSTNSRFHTASTTSSTSSVQTKSHPILDNLNTSLYNRDVDFVLRTRGVRPTSAAAMKRRTPNRNRNQRPATAAANFSSSSPERSMYNSPSTSNKRPSTASYKSSFNTPQAYNWKFKPENTRDDIDDILSGAPPPQGSATKAGRWRRFQQLQQDVFLAQNQRAAERVAECRRAKGNMWQALDKIRHIMERDAHDRESKRKQVHRMFVACAAGFGATEAPLVTLPQFLSRFCTFGYLWNEIEAPLKRAFVAFDADLDGLVDWRDIIIALRIATFPLEPAPDRLKRFFRLYSDDTNYMDAATLLHMMTVTLYDQQSVERVAGAIHVWLNASGFPLPGIYGDHFIALVEHEWEIAEEEWMTIGPVKAVVHIDSFLLVMWHDWFNGMSSEMRLRVADDRQQASLQMIKEAETRMDVRKAVKMWQRKTLARVFHQFWYGCHLNHCDKMALYHDTARCRKRGLRRWHTNANASARMGAMNAGAESFRNLWLKKNHFGEWKHFWIRCCMRNKRMAEQAARWQRNVNLEFYFGVFKRYWERRLAKYNAIAFWHGLEKKNYFRTWRDNVKYSISTRKAADTLAEIRGDVFVGKVDSIDAEIEAYKKQIELEFQQKKENERLEKERIRAAEDLWSEQKIEAYTKGQDRRKMKMQEEEWRAVREKKKVLDLTKESNMWEKMHRHIAEDAEFEAYTFLRSPMGKDLLKVRTLQVRKEGGLRDDQVANGLDTELAEGEDPEKYNARILIMAMTSNAEFVKLFDPLLNEAFFYNCRTGDRLTAEDLSYEEAEKIAMEVYIAEQIEKAYTNAKESKIKDTRDRLEEFAANKINNFMRANYYKKHMRKMFLKIFVVKMDSSTSEPYYLNTHSGKSQWTKPLALKTVKMNFPEWVLMRDASQNGKVYYKQTIKPNDVSWEKPPSWLLCVTCRVDFPVRRCLDCDPHALQCIDCFIASHPNPAFVEGADPTIFKHKFETVATIQKYCTMCKQKLATKQCVECGGEQFCDKCFGMMHGKARRKKTSMSSHIDVIDI